MFVPMRPDTAFTRASPRLDNALDRLLHRHASQAAQAARKISLKPTPGIKPAAPAAQLRQHGDAAAAAKHALQSPPAASAPVRASSAAEPGPSSLKYWTLGARSAISASASAGNSVWRYMGICGACWIMMGASLALAKLDIETRQTSELPLSIVAGGKAHQRGRFVLLRIRALAAQPLPGWLGAMPMISGNARRPARWR